MSVNISLMVSEPEPYVSSLRDYYTHGFQTLVWDLTCRVN
jgi:hypothetical protein